MDDLRVARMVQSQKLYAAEQHVPPHTQHTRHDVLS
jgi:hypothetical protein